MEDNLEQNQNQTPQPTEAAESKSESINSEETESLSSSQVTENGKEVILNQSPILGNHRKNKQPENIDIAKEAARQSGKKSDFFGQTTSQSKDSIDISLSSSFLETERDESKEEKELDDLPLEILKDRLDRVSQEIKSKNIEYKLLVSKIEDFIEARSLDISILNQLAYKRQKQQYEQDKEAVRIDLENFENEAQRIKQELDKREQKRLESNEDSNKVKSITASSLFVGKDSIVHTILYVATFFQDLTPKEFKKVVSYFLQNQTIEKTKQRKVIEGDKIQIFETSDVEKQKLNEVWEESFSHPDQYLEKCSIKVRRSEKSSLVIDFSVPYLRNALKTYFQEEQTLYIEERLKQVPELLFDSSENVVDRAIDLLAEAAVDYPDDYEAGWLLEITTAVENIKDERLFIRLSKLIYQMQIWLDPSKSKQVIETFFNRLLSTERRYAFGIVLYLIFRHLCSTWLFNRIELSKQLLDWLKQVLDKSDQLEDEDKKQLNKVGVYSVLETLLWQNETSDYIYDILEILRDWLPEKEIAPEEIPLSSQVALFLLATYFEESVSALSYNEYGEWPSTYPLFVSFSDENNSFCRLKFSILLSLLFHSDTDSNSSKNRERNLTFRYVLPIETVDWIGFLVAEWFTILCGQRNHTHHKSSLDDSRNDLTASDIADQLLEKVILASETSEQKRLIEYWAKLANTYLDKAEKYANFGNENEKLKNEKLKNEFVFRRRIVRDLRKRFQIIRKETLLIEEGV